MRKFILLILLVNCGCATIFSSAGFEMSSTLLTFGSLGQTLINMTATESGRMSVGPLPPHYSQDPERMLREAWEQNFIVIKKTSWEGEEEPWKELVASTARKAGNSAPRFALVEKKALREDVRREEITLFRTVSGKTLVAPAQPLGEAFYPLVQDRDTVIPVFMYTAWYFSRSRQPSGILASNAAAPSPCGRTGVRILAVGKKTPADTGGLLAGDIITQVNGRSVDYATLFATLRQGANTVTFCRNGQAQTLAVKLPEPQRK